MFREIRQIFLVVGLCVGFAGPLAGHQRQVPEAVKGGHEDAVGEGDLDPLDFWAAGRGLGGVGGGGGAEQQQQQQQHVPRD